jgi:hypothetical protein
MTKVPEISKFKVPNSLKNRDKEQKQKMKYYADKRMSNNFQKYRIGQNVILALLIERTISTSGNLE